MALSNNYKDIPVTTKKVNSDTNKPVSELPVTNSKVNKNYTNQGNSYYQGYSQASARNFDLEPYKKLVHNINTNLDIDILNEDRARNQSGMRLAGSAVVQTIGTFVGDIVSGFGSIFSIGGSLGELMLNVFNEDYKPEDRDPNFLQKFGAGISNFSKDIAPIYTTKRAQAGIGYGAMGDATWWFSNIPTLASAAASMVPVFGTMGGIAKLGKAMTLARTTTGLGKLSKRIGTTLTSNKFKGIAGTVLGAHIDVEQEIIHGFSEKIEYAKSLGMSEKEAQQYASIWAAQSYRNGIAYGILFNGIEIHAILKGSKVASQTVAKSDKMIRKQIPEMVRDKAYTGLTEEVEKASIKSVARSGLKGTYEYLKTGIAEGLEEMRVDVALAEGELKAKKAFGIYDPDSDKTALQRLSSHISDTRNWDSFFWGMAGGVTMYGGRSLLNKLGNPKADREYAKVLYETTFNSLKDITTLVGTYNGDLSVRAKIQEDPMVTLLAPLFNTLGSANAIDYGEVLLDELSKLSSQELTEIYGADKTELIKVMQKEFKIAQKIYNKNHKTNWGTKNDDYVRNQIAGNEYLQDYFERKLVATETELERLKVENNDIELERDNALKNINPQIYELNNRKTQLNEKLNSIKEVSSKLQELISDKDLSKKYEEIKNQRSIIEESIKKNNEELSKNRDIVSKNTAKIKSIDSKLLKINKSDIETIKGLNEERANLVKEIETSSTNISDIQTRIEENNVKREKLNTGIAYFEKEIEIQSAAKQFNDSETESINKDLETINKELARLKELNPEIFEEYNRKESEYKDKQSPDSDEITNLKKLRLSIMNHVNHYKSLNDNKRKYADNISSALDYILDHEDKEISATEKRDKSKEKIEEEKKATEEVVKKPNAKSISTSIVGTDFVSTIVNDNDEIVSTIINGTRYDVGSKYNYNGKESTITKMFDYNGLTAFTIDTDDVIHISTLFHEEVSNNSSDKVLQAIGDIVMSFKQSQFEGKYAETIKRLDAAIDSKKFKEAFLSKTDSMVVINRRESAFQNLIEFVNNHLSEDETQFIVDIADSIVDKLNQYHAKNATDAIMLELRNMLTNMFVNKDAYLPVEILNEYFKNYLTPFVNKLSNIMYKNIRINNANDFIVKLDKDVNSVITEIERAAIDLMDIVETKLQKAYPLEELSDFSTHILTSSNKLISKIKKDTANEREKGRKIEEEYGIPQEDFNDEILNYSIIKFTEIAEEVNEADESVTKNGDFEESDFRHYISPNRLKLLNALYSLIESWKSSREVNSDKQLDYDTILELLYNTQNGDEQIESNYRSIWRTLTSVFDRNQLFPLITEMAEKVSTNELAKFRNLVDIITSSIKDPRYTVKPKYIDRFGLVKKSFLADFKSRVTPTDRTFSLDRGIPLSVNFISDSIKSQIDSKYNTVDSTITIDGEEYKTKDVIDAYKKLNSDTPIIQKLNDAKTEVRLYVTHNGTDIPIGYISLTEHLKIGKLSVVRPSNDESGTLLFDNFLGTSTKLKQATVSLVDGLSKSDKAFGIVQSFFKEYRQAITDGDVNTETIETKLKDIILGLNEIGNTTESGNSVIMNAILNMSNYNTDREDTNDIDVHDIYTVIQPMFYGKYSNVDSVSNSYDYLINAYDNYRKAKLNQFDRSNEINKYIANNNADLFISYITKPGIKYDDNIDAQSNIKDVAQKESVINIVSIDSDGKAITKTKAAPKIIFKHSTRTGFDLSSLNDGTAITDEELILKAQASKSNFWVEVKLNDTERGVSHIPVKLNNLRNHDVLREFTKHNIGKIIKDKFMTDLSVKTIENEDSDSRILRVGDRTKIKYNGDGTTRGEYNTLLDDMAEAIIVNSSDGTKHPWFDVGTIFDNPHYMKKNIRFMINYGTKAYAITMDIHYKKDADPDNPSVVTGIKFHANLSKNERGVNQDLQFFKSTSLDKFGFVKRDGDSDTGGNLTYKIEDDKSIYFKFNEEKDIDTFLQSGLFDALVGHMPRNVKVDKYNGGDTFAFTGTGASFGENLNQVDGVTVLNGNSNNRIIRGKVTSPALVWGKQQGIYDGVTEFDSIQDYYLDTMGLTSNMIPIRDSENGEVLTNYDFGASESKIYFNGNIRESISDIPVESPTVSASDIATRNMIISLESNDNFISVLNEKHGLTKESLIKLGFLKEDVRDVVYEAFKDYLLTYAPKDSKLELLFTNDPIDNDNSIVGQYKSRQQSIILRRDYVRQDPNTASIALLHEFVHHSLITAFKNKELSQGVKKDLNNIIKDIVNENNEVIDFSNLSQEEIADLKKYILEITNSKPEAINATAYNEFVAHLFVNKNFVDVLNRIGYKKSTKVGTSVWRHIFYMFMNILGVNKINNNSVLEEIGNTLSRGFSNKGGVQVGNITNPSSPPAQSTSSSTPTIEERSIMDMDDDALIDDVEDIYYKPSEVLPAGGGDGLGSNVPLSTGIWNTQNNLVSLDKDITTLKDFKDTNTDETNLKIC